MTDRYDQTAASMPTELEEIESPRALDTLENWALSPAGKTFIYLFAMGGGAAMAFMGYRRPSDFLFVTGVALAFGGFGAYMMLRERLSSYGYEVHYTRRSKPVQMAEPPKLTRRTITLDLNNGHPPQAIWQPDDKPGAFRQWLADVLNPDGRVQFSKNEAKRRGWPDNEYDYLIIQLRECGLLHPSDMFNHAPLVTESGKRKAREWLKNNSPSPTDE